MLWNHVLIWISHWRETDRHKHISVHTKKDHLDTLRRHGGPSIYGHWNMGDCYPRIWHDAEQIGFGLPDFQTYAFGRLWGCLQWLCINNIIQFQAPTLTLVAPWCGWNNHFDPFCISATSLTLLKDAQVTKLWGPLFSAVGQQKGGPFATKW